MIDWCIEKPKGIKVADDSDAMKAPPPGAASPRVRVPATTGNAAKVPIA
jgi:hypothetical protein